MTSPCITRSASLPVRVCTLTSSGGIARLKSFTVETPSPGQCYEANLTPCPTLTLVSPYRALKTRSNTPKYGLIFHSSFIGRAKQRNKGRISRYLANKCSIASRCWPLPLLPCPGPCESYLGMPSLVAHYLSSLNLAVQWQLDFVSDHKAIRLDCCFCQQSCCLTLEHILLMRALCPRICWLCQLP